VSAEKVQAGRVAVVIMAAGKGTRLKSNRPKVLHEIGGKPLLSHVIAAAAKIVPAQAIFAVVGHQAERVQKAVEASGIGFVLQAEQRGTGHAIQCAAPSIEGFEHIVVLSGDAPLIKSSTLERMLAFHLAENAAMTILTARPENAYGYGRILHPATDAAVVSAIVEQKALTPEQESVGEINSGIYVFRTADLLSHLGKLDANNANCEVILTDMARLLGAAGGRVVSVEVAEASEVLGANTIAELVALDATMRAEKAASLMAEGVTILKPETCLIDAEVEVAADTVIEPFVQLLGTTKVGAECRIRSYSTLENAVIGDRVTIRQSSVLTDCIVCEEAIIGPFSHIRPQSEIGPRAHVGNFVETKKTKLGEGAKANHLAYVGDAEVGAKTNIGAGVITCNYDGKNKFKTSIGAGAFIGSDSTLVAPVTIGDGAYIGAGSCITREVPADALAVGRARQVVKEGWGAAKRKQQNS